MENILLSLNVVVPIFLLMLLGFFLRRIGLVENTGVNLLNKLVFNVLLPVMLFNNISEAVAGAVFNRRLFIWAAVSLMTLFALLLFIIPRIEKNPRRVPVIIQGIYRSNFVIFGITVAEVLAGKGNVGVIALLVALVSPMFNTMAAWVFAASAKGRPGFLATVKTVLTNPMVCGSLLGLLFSLLSIRLPQMIRLPMESLGNSASAIGLIALGAGFSLKNIRANASRLVLTTVGKLILVPLAFLPLSAALGFRGVELIGLAVLFASPSAFSGYTMAESAGADGELAAQTIVVSSLFSVITVFLTIYLLKSAGLI